MYVPFAVSFIIHKRTAKNKAKKLAKKKLLAKCIDFQVFMENFNASFFRGGNSSKTKHWHWHPLRYSGAYIRPKINRCG